MDLYEAGLNAGTFGRKEVEFLHARGIRVFSNLGDTPSWWAEMDRLGVDGFKTNCIGCIMNGERMGSGLFYCSCKNSDFEGKWINKNSDFA